MKTATSLILASLFAVGMTACDAEQADTANPQDAMDKATESTDAAVEDANATMDEGEGAVDEAMGNETEETDEAADGEEADEAADEAAAE